MHSTPAVERLAALFEERSTSRLIAIDDKSAITYRDFWRRAEGAAARLGEMGLQPGNRVLLQLANSEHALLLYLSCAIGGFVACPVDPVLPEAQLRSCTSILKPVLHVKDNNISTVLQPAKSRLGKSQGNSDDPFLIVFSSGSTGEAKGIVHSLETIIASAASFAGIAGMDEDSVVYHHFPMFYMAGIFNLFFVPIMAGGQIVLGERFSKTQMLRFWERPIKYDINSLTLTPTMAQSLCQLYRPDDRVLRLLGKSQSIVSTGSTLLPATAEKFHNTFHVPMRNCYGVTEVGGTITFQAWEDALAYESTGSWADDTVIRAGAEGSPQEILVKTPFLSKGYLTAAQECPVCDSDGFFHTGDLGYIKDGALFFSGREHDLLKKGGEFVSTQMIENVALKCPLVVEVAALGAPDEFWGSKIVLFYVPQRDASEERILGEFRRLFAEELRDIERPDKVIAVPWMPKTSVGKILKRQLLAKYSLK